MSDKKDLMVSIYGDSIIKGRRVITDVSVDFKEDVCQWLIDNGYPELAEDNV